VCFGIANAPVTDVLIDRMNRCWVSSYGAGLLVFDAAGNSIPAGSLKSDAGLFVYDLEADYSGNVWAGTDAGLWRYRVADDSLKADALYELKLPDLIIRALDLDEYNRLWIGFQEGGVCYYLIDEERFVFLDTPSGFLPEITSLCYQGDELWIGMAFGGLASLNPGSGSFTRYENELLSRRIVALTQSQLGGLWITGTENIMYSSGNQILFYGNQLQGNVGSKDIQALIQDKQGYLWYCTDEGLFRFHPDRPETLPAAKWFKNNILDEVFLTCLYEDDYGYLWAGSFDKGVFRISPDRKTIEKFNESNGLSNNNVLRIDGYENQLWFATLGGVSHAIAEPGGKVRFATAGLQEGYNNAYFYTVFVDAQKRVWLGTDGHGPQMIENGYHHTGLLPELSDKVVYSITADQEGRIWLAVPDEGLYCVTGDSIRKIGIGDGLSSTQITALSPTQSNYLLVSGYEGIDLVNIYTFAVSGHYRSFGIRNLKPNLNALFCNDSGSCFAGSQQGIIRLNRISEMANRKPIMQLSEHNVNLSAAGQPGMMHFKSNENHHVMRYTAIWYPAPEDVFYRLRLQGLDTSWQTTRNHEAVYPSLRPGNYLWEAEASLSRNFLHTSSIAFSFSIAKPMWQQWWAWLSVLVLLILIVYWVFRVRIEKLRLVELQKQKQAEFDYLLLRNQVNPHFLFNSFGTLISVIELDKLKAIEYVEKLSDYFRNILQYRDQQLISLTEELRLLETYIFLQQQRYGQNLGIETELPDVYLNSLIPPMSLQMLAENAVKHNRISKATPLNISITVSGENLVISNNIQLRQSPERSTGLGIRNISERYRMITGKEVVVQNTGTRFIVKLPIINA
jgi:ligand-binding sensor domain-containing protein